MIAFALFFSALPDVSSDAKPMGGSHVFLRAPVGGTRQETIGIWLSRFVQCAGKGARGCGHFELHKRGLPVQR